VNFTVQVVAAARVRDDYKEMVNRNTGNQIDITPGSVHFFPPPAPPPPPI
jgi:hypothetical protein